MFKKLKQLKALILDILLFVKMKKFSAQKSGNKVLYVSFRNPNLYHRYFYNMLKSFRIAGYEIVYPMDFSKFRNLRNGDIYLALMFQEKGFLNIKNIPKQKHFLEITDEMFSADYYKTYFKDGNMETDSFHIPMSFHPYMYHFGYWDEELNEDSELRINSLFSFGNFDRNAYKTVNKVPFKVINRADLIEFSAKNDTFISVKSKQELEQIIAEKTNNHLIFCEKYNYNIPLEEVRNYLSKFRYFLCCPGVFAPLSHNLVEAMSSGTIPVIQKSYADFIYPALEHQKNAIIFEDENDLNNWLQKALFEISDAEYLLMKENVKYYYEKYLHPASATENIRTMLNKKTLYLNASERSVNLIKN